MYYEDSGYKTSKIFISNSKILYKKEINKKPFYNGFFVCNQIHNIGINYAFIDNK
jgi:hypothetical protein